MKGPKSSFRLELYEMEVVNNILRQQSQEHNHIRRPAVFTTDVNIAEGGITSTKSIQYQEPILTAAQRGSVLNSFFKKL